MKLKFGIDVDGVLRDLIGNILRLYNLKFSANLQRKDFIYYDVQDMFPDIPDAGKFFFSGENAKVLLGDSLPVSGALNAFNLLTEIGDVYIVTSQHGYNNILYTLNWLYKNGFKTDQLCFVTDKSIVTGLDYFIDDNPDKFINCRCKHGILIDMPYNRHDISDVLKTCKCETFTRHSSLEAFTNTLINIEKR